MKVYILVNNNSDTKVGDIIGIYTDEVKAKVALADYVINGKPFAYESMGLIEYEVIE